MNQAYCLSEQQKYYLPEQLKSEFAREGFIGPFPSFLSDREIDEYRDYFEDIVSNKREHPLYGRFSVRDWHLVSTKVRYLFTHPAIVSCLISLAGEDLVLWRSKIFYKRPNEGELGWHQEWGYFNGEEIGNDKPSLIPKASEEKWWNLTVWIAFDDITLDNGPVQFVRGSHKTRYPIEMVPMTKSGFFHDPFIGVDDPNVIINLAKHSKLVLDINTSNLFEGVDATNFTMDELKSYVYRKLSEKKAAVTLLFDAEPGSIATMTMRKGEFVIFTERTMHGSLSNKTNKSRVAVNCRITTTDTLIYPGRLRGDYIDGSNIDISKHHCILLSGKNRNRDNVYS
jgi:non-haem Fe2+, alpha-ketoglutarate-dependent halogenase